MKRRGKIDLLEDPSLLGLSFTKEMVERVRLDTSPPIWLHHFSDNCFLALSLAMRPMAQPGINGVQGYHNAYGPITDAHFEALKELVPSMQIISQKSEMIAAIVRVSPTDLVYLRLMAD